MAADGLGLLQDLRGSLPGLCRRLRPRSDKTVPRLALENWTCRLIWGDVVWALRVASAFPQTWAYSRGGESGRRDPAWVAATSAWIHQVLQRREDGKPDIFRVLT